MLEIKDIDSFSQKEAGKYVGELWQNNLQATQTYRSKLVSWYKQYRGIPSRKNYEGLANVFINETLAAVESIVAQIYHTIRSETKPFYAKPFEETDEEKASLAEDIVTSSLENMKVEPKILRQIRQKVKYGTTVAKVRWKVEEKTVSFRTRTEEMGVVSSQIQNKKKVTYEDVELDYIDLLDAAFDYGRSSIEEMNWIIVRKFLTYDDIVSAGRRNLYGNIDKVPKVAKLSGEDKKAERVQQTGVNLQAIDRPPYEILEFWGKAPIWFVEEGIDINSEEASEMVESVIEVLIVPEKIVLRMERNPYWHQKKPFLLDQYIEVDNEPYGIGVCEILEYLQQELNDKRNQSLDAVTFRIFPVLEKLRSANIRNEDIEFLPRKVIPSDTRDGLRPLTMVGEISSEAGMEGIIKQDMRHESGATAPVQGIQEGGERTAFEVDILQRRGASRISISTIEFANKFLRPFYNFIYQLHQQFTSAEKAIARVGKKGIRWIRWTPEDVISNFDIIPVVPTDLSDRTIVRNQMIQFIGQIAKFYPQVNAYKIVRKVYDLFGFADGEEIVPQPDVEKGQGSLTDEEEITLLEIGQKIDVKFWENHFDKISLLSAYLMSNQNRLTEKAMVAFQDKILQHQRYLDALQKQAPLGQPFEAPLPIGQVPLSRPAGINRIETPNFPQRPTQAISELAKELT